jgi:oxygen-independent coproporphyrinogen-3 oxidase
MAGLYFHIPFCKQACIYCDFHFSTSLEKKSQVLNAMLRELELRKDELQDEIVETLYFGGGTPSLLSGDEIKTFIERSSALFLLDEDAEITLEANPDDLDDNYLHAIRAAGVNRISIGIQSFKEEELSWMNRAHTASQAIRSIEEARKAGFSNISADLIFATPYTSMHSLVKNLDMLCDLSIPHLSCYNLTVEERTLLHKLVKENKAATVPDEASQEQFYFIHHYLLSRGYEHYEISNYAKPEMLSRHNTAYWQRKKYLGIGPAAHSFDGKSRSWNVRSNTKYLQEINAGVLPSEKEILSENDRFNEIVFTGLRTIWGVNMQELIAEFPVQCKEAEAAMKGLLDEGKLVMEKGNLVIPVPYWIVADGIAAELFVVA